MTSTVAELPGLAEALSIRQVSRATANVWLNQWMHPLGPCDRPFGQEQWGMFVRGKPVAVAITASIVSPSIRDEQQIEWPRNEVVELARIGRSLSAPWAMRPMLRLWREVFATEWAHWTPQLAVSYALPGYSGNIYRFDGWTKVRVVKRSAPGKSSTWSKASATDQIGDGRKTLWAWHFDAPDQDSRVKSPTPLAPLVMNISHSPVDFHPAACECHSDGAS